MIRLLFFFLLAGTSLPAQSYMKLGFTGGPTFSWASSETQLNNNFFEVARAGFSGGVTTSLHAGEHFFARATAGFSKQVFAIRQNSDPRWGVDIRYRSNNIELPFCAGYTGYLGSLIHREYVGGGLMLNINRNSRVELTGDSSAAFLTHQSSTDQSMGSYPFVLAGFEVGARFNNDGALFFGGSFRYGFQPVFKGRFENSRFPVQYPAYNGAYLGIEVTWYLPRFSYWFKREFTF